MKRQTPIKDEIYKTDIYLKHQKLIYKLAHQYMNKVNLDFDDILSEFHIIFCTCVQKYIPSKGNCFSTYLYCCCRNRIYSLIKINNDPKRNQKLIIEVESIDELGEEPDFIIFDNFINNKNPVIRSVMDILSTYKLPNKAIKTWLKSILKTYGYNYTEILKAFRIIKTLY